MHNPVAVGNILRDHIICLLEAQGYLVEREIRVHTKRIDILLTIEDDLSRRRIAIEAKNVNQNLGQKDVALIYVEHEGLIRTRAIDEIWVVARNDFSPEAKNWAALQPGFSLFTIAQFEERQFGFHRYVRQLMEMFTENDLNEYYVQQRISEHELLSKKVDDWINGQNGKPIAILGGYGMGKTSFCKFLVAELGRRYIEDSLNRVPIYIRLSEIAKEQDLDGLLGKMLASKHRLKNYNFNDIMNLNKQGKLVFIFDGFDEMKHALTWDIFKYNFSEINRTVCERSRVLLAGRPNAFLSDAEHSWALRGTRVSGERTIKIQGWPEYEELAIQPFSHSEAEIFLRRYLANNAKRSETAADDALSEWIDSRVAEFDALSKREDISRPVHLKIFSELATDRNFTLRTFSAFELYQIAADQTIEREMTKQERLPIGGQERARFIEDVAWWLWEKDNGRSLHFDPRDVPASIWRRAIPMSHDYTDETIMRELFSGAFIERKFGDNFYFAHRSFLEFFVAKKMTQAKRNEFSLGQINSTVNEEIIDFVKSSGHFDKFIDYILAMMHRYSGELKLLLLKEIKSYIKENVGAKESVEFQQHVELLMKALPLYEMSEPKDARPLVDDLIEHDLLAINHDKAQQTLYFLVDATLYDIKNPEFKSSLNEICRFLARNVKTSYWKTAKREMSVLPSLRFSRENIFEYIFLRSTRITAELAPDGAPVAQVDFGRIFIDLMDRRPKIWVSNRIDPPEPGKYVHAMRFEDLGFPPQDNAVMLEVLRQGIDTRIRPSTGRQRP